MFEALILACFLVIWISCRWVRQCVLCDSKCSQVVRYVLLADYAVLYAFFFIFFWIIMGNIFSNLPETGWLDPDTLDQIFADAYSARRLSANLTGSNSSGDANTANLTSQAANVLGKGANMLPEGVLEEISIRPYPLVRWASIFAPMPVLATWVICGWDTWTHARVIWMKAAGSTEAHDLAIQIIALPMVYSLLSLSALVRMWKIMSNTFGEDADEPWAERFTHDMERYEAAYQVADLYEAWALHHFAVLAMQVLRKIFHASGGHLNQVDTSSPVYQAWAGTLRGLHKSVRSLTMQGIWSFVIVCAVSAMYGLTAPILEEAFALDTSAAMKDKVRFFFLGMGTVASTAAICNILQIERRFHHELLLFKPFWKFWGTKVLVSIAFLQSLLFMLPFPPFRSMSEVQANLMYSTLLCYECLFISLIHMYAWRATEQWYQEHSIEENKGLTALESLDLQIQSSTETFNAAGSTQASFDSSRELKATQFGAKASDDHRASS